MARAQSSPCSRSPKGSAGLSCLAGPARSCSLSPLRAGHCAMHVAAVGRRPRALAQPVAAAAARGAAPSPPRLSLLLSLLRKAPPVLHLWLQAARHLCRARTRMREIWCVVRGRGVARTRRARPRSLRRRRASRSCLATRMIDVPLSGPKRQNSSEKGRARSTRGAGGRQTLPTPWPIGTAHTQAPDRSRRRPGSVLHCCTVDFSS